jgi:hypothetical protein
MQLDTDKYILAIFVAPLSSGLGLSLAWSIPSISLTKLVTGAFVLTPIAYPFALVGILVLGLPSLLVLKRLRLLNFFTLSFIGLPLGYLSAIVTGDLNDPLWLKTVCIVGPIVSTSAALIMFKKPNNTP